MQTIVHPTNVALQVVALELPPLLCDNAQLEEPTINMDFLDPHKRRQSHIRLIIGYVLVGIAILLATVILVYAAYGYSINPKTGNVVQNGLLFVGSQPSGANIYLNGTSRNSTTSARLVLAAGNYTLKLTKTGYRDWQRNIVLSEQSIDRFVYPFLFPTKPRVTPIKPYSAAPSLITETPDRHWLLVEALNSDPATVSFDEFDTTKLDQASQPITLPSDLLTSPDQPGSVLTEVAWSTDNVHLLLKHDYQGGSEFVVLDRTSPTDSFNVNKTLGINPTQVVLRNEKVDQLYVYDGSAQTLSVADTTKDVVDPAFLTHVLAFKGYGTSLLTYVTDNKMPAGQAQARIWDNGQTYALNSFPVGDHYLIDAAQYQGDWFYAAGSSSADHVNLYKNPLDSLQNSSIGKAEAFISLRVNNASKIGFSTNTRFIEVESGQQFGVYDFETDTRFQYTLQAALVGPLQWMDGHRLMGESAGKFFVMDYDGINQQLLTPTNFAEGGFFSSDYNHLLTTAPASDGSSVSLENIDMRAGADLPASTQ